MDLKDSIRQDLIKSRGHFEYSYNKVIKFNLEDDFTEEELETLESFSSRFARFSDILIAKYFRFLAREADPAFKGSLIDLLNLAEKNSWIESATTWRRIRELRNVAAHEYSSSDYRRLYSELVSLAPTLLAVNI
ncbi:MAG: HepT-like ribonuclease domain-containing protein [Bdellovibrionales bacterium]